MLKDFVEYIKNFKELWTELLDFKRDAPIYEKILAPIIFIWWPIMVILTILIIPLLIWLGGCWLWDKIF